MEGGGVNAQTIHINYTYMTPLQSYPLYNQSSGMGIKNGKVSLKVWALGSQKAPSGGPGTMAPVGVRGQAPWSWSFLTKIRRLFFSAYIFGGGHFFFSNENPRPIPMPDHIKSFGNFMPLTNRLIPQGWFLSSSCNFEWSSRPFRLVSNCRV